MRSLVFLIFIFAASFGDLNYNSKVRNFSIELLYQAVQDSDENVMISPYAIWYLLLSVAYETKGDTREQLSKVFLLTEDRSEVVTECRKHRTSVIPEDFYTKFANLLFYDEHLNVYLDSIQRLENDFDFKTQRLDFEEHQRALDSAWKTLESHGMNYYNTLRTKDFIDSTVIMCNEIQFQKNWSNDFKVTGTDYYRDGNKTTKIDIMYMKAPLRFANLESLHASVTELPYRGDTHCMLLVRPHGGYTVHQVLRELRRVSLADVLDKLQSDADEFGLREIEVKLPELFHQTHIVLDKPLVNMGFSNMFDPNLDNFQNFADANIYIGEIVHQVHINFSEFLTYVSSSTPWFESDMNFVLHPIPKKRIPIRDPFIYFIMEKSTATILLGGSVSKIGLY